MLRTTMAAIAAAVLLIAPASAAPSAGDPVLGRWLTQSRKAHVEIAPCGASVCGTIVWLADEKDGHILKDANNKDPAKRGARVLGSRMMWDFKPAAHGWTNGRIYNAEDGATYRSVLKPQGDGTLIVDGCVGPICRSQKWTRVP
ncbi:MAG: DUF2147 domain-containing protein [Alphaproteobacteria bacterium]|nr:DUF2147 domain-containing protein [Alphaproteobacteria bacterium]